MLVAVCSKCKGQLILGGTHPDHYIDVCPDECPHCGEDTKVKGWRNPLGLPDPDDSAYPGPDPHVTIKG